MYVIIVEHDIIMYHKYQEGITFGYDIHRYESATYTSVLHDLIK